MTWTEQPRLQIFLLVNLNKICIENNIVENNKFNNDTYFLCCTEDTKPTIQPTTMTAQLIVTTTALVTQAPTGNKIIQK